MASQIIYFSTWIMFRKLFSFAFAICHCTSPFRLPFCFALDHFIILLLSSCPSLTASFSSQLAHFSCPSPFIYQICPSPSLLLLSNLNPFRSVSLSFIRTSLLPCISRLGSVPFTLFCIHIFMFSSSFCYEISFWIDLARFRW